MNRCTCCVIKTHEPCWCEPSPNPNPISMSALVPVMDQIHTSVICSFINVSRKRQDQRFHVLHLTGNFKLMACVCPKVEVSTVPAQVPTGDQLDLGCAGGASD